MNKLITFTGGKPNFNIDDILWNDDAYRLAITAILAAFGDNYIVQGCATPGDAGYIMLGGELLRVDAHTPTNTYYQKVTTYDAGGDVTFNDGTARQTWQKNRATKTSATGVTLSTLDVKLYQFIDTAAISSAALSGQNGWVITGQIIKTRGGMVTIFITGMDNSAATGETFYTIPAAYLPAQSTGVISMTASTLGFTLRSILISCATGAMTSSRGTGITDGTGCITYRATY